MKIISGGQTGIDRAALDVALKHGVECGGWVPAGRLDEQGEIAARYPVTELPKGGFAERTAANVKDSEATVAIFSDGLGGGTEYAVQCCIKQRKPYLLINAMQTPAEAAAELIMKFVREHRIRILGVGGPRQSEWPGGYDYAFRALEIFLALCRSRDPDKLTRSAAP
ncbi:MAG: hypothetical protein QOG67_1221 [Verrucomicrobiota bacterium]|jgi:predicted Rossmann-fold nucleotide-binding protein